MHDILEEKFDIYLKFIQTEEDDAACDLVGEILDVDKSMIQCMDTEFIVKAVENAGYKLEAYRVNGDTSVVFRAVPLDIKYVEENQHDWFQSKPEWKFESCRKCGVVRQKDGLTDKKECKGVVRVVLRDN